MIFTVRQARVLAGLTQADVAKRLEMPVNTYRRREMYPEKMSVPTALRFAEIVKLPLDQIFFGEGLPKVDTTRPDARSQRKEAPC